MVGAKWFTQYTTHTQYNKPEIANLIGNETLTLKRRGQTITVQSGCAWITFDGQDHIIESGQDLFIGHGKNIAAISSANKHEIAIKIMTN